MQEKMNDLMALMREAWDFQGSIMVLGWDARTKMPHGNTLRGRQIAMLSRYEHEIWTSDNMGRLLDDLVTYSETLDYDSNDAAFIRVAKEQYEQRRKVPSAFTAKMREHASKTESIWQQARGEDDFSKVQPYLEKTLELSREQAQFYDFDHIADPFIAESNPGITAKDVLTWYGELRPALVDLVQRISEAEQVDDSFLYRHFPKEQQYDFAREAITAFGYDFNRGRMDETHHPFATTSGYGDARITTRGDDNHLGDAVFATMHEAGHAMYMQGVKEDFADTLLIRGSSSGVHESQSRLWENRVGRGREFWQAYYRKLLTMFPEQLNNISMEAFYKAINKVQPSLIRVQADEVTYNLHIMIRSSLEIEMLEGSLAIKDLPDAWRERYTSDLGVTPEDDKDGCMQDVH